MIESVEFEQESPTDQKLITSPSGEVYDIAGELRFSTDLSVALENHSAKQVWWESIATELSSRAQKFELIQYGKWMAHSRHYAKLALKGMGEERTTLDDIRDTVIRIYGKETREEARETYCRYAHLAYLCLTEGSLKNAERVKSSHPDRYKASYDLFHQEMFSYLAGEKPWYYETVVGVLLDLKEQAEKVRSVAKGFDKRAYSMKEFVDLEKAKYGNVGPLAMEEVVDKVTEKVKKQLINGVDEQSLMKGLCR